MSKQATKTDNSKLDAKVKLRIKHLPDAKKIKVLDCYAGSGMIWQTIRLRLPAKQIDILSIDKKKHTGGVHLVGDNRKFLPSLDLRNFDIVDLDAYGVPFNILSDILSRDDAGHLSLFITFNSTAWKALPHKLLVACGLSSAMIKKCPTLFFHHAEEKFYGFLFEKGIKKAHVYTVKKGPNVCRYIYCKREK